MDARRLESRFAVVLFLFVLRDDLSSAISVRRLHDHFHGNDVNSGERSLLLVRERAFDSRFFQFASDHTGDHGIRRLIDNNRLVICRFTVTLDLPQHCKGRTFAPGRPQVASTPTRAAG